MMSMRADVAIVHGAGVLTDGLPTDIGMRQTLLAGKLLEDGIVGGLILCGRGPNSNDDYVITEAEAMKDVLLDRGIDDELMFTESKSVSTLGNLVFGTEVALAEGAESFVGVSRPSQLRRAETAAQFVSAKNGLDYRGYELAEERFRPTSVVREGFQRVLLRKFLAKHGDLELPEIPEVYEDYKRQYRLNVVKQLRYQTHSD